MRLEVSIEVYKKLLILVFFLLAMNIGFIFINKVSLIFNYVSLFIIILILFGIKEKELSGVEE